MKRRKFIGTVLATGTTTGLLPDNSVADNSVADNSVADNSVADVAEEKTSIQVIDSNVSLFRWPFRKLPLDVPSLLVKKMQSLGITQAFAGSFEGVFHRDLASVNRRLAGQCREFPELLPIGSVNPSLPAWEKQLQGCAEDHGMPGIRLHPNYHGYSLDDSRFRQLLELAADAGLIVQLAATMEDKRTQNSVAVVPDVNLSPLAEVVGAVPGARVQVLNWRPRLADLEAMKEVPGILFDTARVDATDGVEQLQRVVSPDRVLFGSDAPFLIPEASLIRLMHESALEEDALRKIAQRNAEGVMGKTLG